MSGYFGVAVWQPKFESNVGTLWRSSTIYGAKMIATVGHRYRRQGSDTCKTPRSIPLQPYTDIDDLIEHLPHGCPLIGVELHDESQSLTDFEHPPRGLYLLGAEDKGLPPAVLDRCHHIVQIPTPADFSMNVASAGTIVLHDRYTKRLSRLAIGG